MSQRDYLLWKAKELARFRPRVREIVMKGGFAVGRRQVQLYTPSHPTFSEWRRLVYGSEGRKNPLPLLPYCDELALAVWIMDDGSMSKLSPALTIATSSFSAAEHDRILAWFKERWGVEPAIQQHHRTWGLYLALRFRKADTERIVALVRDFIHPTMLYKLPSARAPRHYAAIALTAGRPSETSTERWKFWFGLLEQYAEREGHAQVTRFHQENGFELGHWVSGQRTAYRAGRLPIERLLLLEGLPNWSWNRGGPQWEKQWRDHFAALKRFADREGTSRVPRHHSEGGFVLGKWVQRQRDLFRAEQLGLQQQRRLQEVPGWTWDPLGETWEESYTWLKRFVEREGHARVPPRHIEENFKLGQWVSVQRKRFGKKTVTPDQVRRLEELPGWIWTTRLHDTGEGRAARSTAP